MTDTPDPRAIAAGLTEDEKKILLIMEPNKEWYVCDLYGHATKLDNDGLIVHRHWFLNFLTPLGVAVRDEVTKDNVQ